MSDIPEGQLYKGPSGIARDSTWLTNEDLPHDRDTVVTIESVVIRRDLKMQGGRPKPVALSLKFVGKTRELMLNATHRKTLSMLFGSPSCEAWFGRTVALFVEQGVRRPDGTNGPAVRIRNKHPKVETKPKPSAATEPESTGGDAAADAAYNEIVGGEP